MDSITVMIEEKDENGKIKYKLVYELVESPLMIIGDNKEKIFLIDEAINLLPKEIFSIFKIWRQKSNYNGDNEQMIIYFDHIRYCFTNHFWD